MRKKFFSSIILVEVVLVLYIIIFRLFKCGRKARGRKRKVLENISDKAKEPGRSSVRIKLQKQILSFLQRVSVAEFE